MTIDISKFKDCHVLVVGDLMIDEYVWGEVDRVSPEAPVQIVMVEKENYTLGGAGNVVNNLTALGAKVSAAGATGTGLNGKLLMDLFENLGVDTECIIREPERPTTKKTRIIAANQHVLRIDRETRRELSEQATEGLIRAIEARIPAVDVVLISDYGKGIVTQTLISRLTTAAKAHQKVTIIDPKGLDFSKYSGATILTPNKKEAGMAAGVEIVDETTRMEAGARLLETAGVEKLLITCGKEGMICFEKGEEPYRIKAEARQVYDVSGAGDTVLAVLGLAIASGASFTHGANLANTAAGIVVGKVGTATVSIKELKAASGSYFGDAVLKHKWMSELPSLISELKGKGSRIVLTNGCFDILHTGHIMLFSASKRLGDVLIVAIDDDASVRTLKGSGRPVLGERERVRILSALDSVDYVVVFSTGDLHRIIEVIRPDILTKGSNYTPEEVIGHELLKKLGGRVVLVPVTEDISSTRIIDNIRNNSSS